MLKQSEFTEKIDENMWRKEETEHLVEVSKKSDKVIKVKLRTRGTVDVVCVYVPKKKCTQDGKYTFGSDMEEEVNLIPDNENSVIGKDLKGHIG